jgi:hypothetical protein
MTVASMGDADADVEPEPDWIVAPVSRLHTRGNQPLRLGGSHARGVFADFRKDFFLPYNQ